MTHTTESTRIEWLISLCKVWGAIKYFHPYLAYRDDIDWDVALVAAIQNFNSAKDTAEYTTAIQTMLMVLGDPATRIIKQESAHIDSSSRERQPVYKFTSDGILVVTINHYEDLLDFYGSIKRMDEVKKEIPKAHGLLFDLRSVAPTQEKGYLQYAFLGSEIIAQLSSMPIVTPGERSRIHQGFVPHKGITSGEYISAFRVVDGRRILPAKDAKDLPIVFLINQWSEIPVEALALQTVEKAIIIVDGDGNDSSLSTTHQIPLNDEVFVEIRLGELVYEDGSSGFIPDIVVAGSQFPSEVDPAFETALDLFSNFKPKMKTRLKPPSYAIQASENSYPEMVFPSSEYRLLAAFRIWTIINYFFSYKDLMGEDWDQVLREFIPKMEQAESALEYHLAVAEMISYIHDSHGYVDSPILKDYFGSAWPPIRLQLIENIPVITTILDEDSVKAAGIRRGDIVLKIDGEDINERLAYHAKYLAASTPQRLMYRSAFSSLSGPENSIAIFTIRDKNNFVKEVQISRKKAFGGLFDSPERDGDITKFITDDIGYVDLDRLQVSAVDEMFEKFKETKAIIFDMRGYPKGTAWAIAPRLGEKNRAAAALFQCPMIMVPDGSNGNIPRQSITNNFVQSIPPAGKWRYMGITIMLIDERTQSQAEHTGLFLKAANGTKFIGGRTSGANGDVTNFYVPGEINISFSGQSVKYADGQQLQRIGLIPDIEVRPTIKGIQAEKDEVLERAIVFLQDQFKTD